MHFVYVQMPSHNNSMETIDTMVRQWTICAFPSTWKGQPEVVLRGCRAMNSTRARHSGSMPQRVSSRRRQKPSACLKGPLLNSK